VVLGSTFKVNKQQYLLNQNEAANILLPRWEIRD